MPYCQSFKTTFTDKNNQHQFFLGDFNETLLAQ